MEASFASLLWLSTDFSVIWRWYKQKVCGISHFWVKNTSNVTHILTICGSRSKLLLQKCMYICNICMYVCMDAPLSVSDRYLCVGTNFEVFHTPLTPNPHTPLHQYFLCRLMSFTVLLSLTFSISIFNAFWCWLFPILNFRLPWGEWVGFMPYEEHPSC